MTTFLVAAIQMDTTSNQDQNLSVVADFIGSRRMANLYPKFALLVLLTLGNSVS